MAQNCGNIGMEALATDSFGNFSKSRNELDSHFNHYFFLSSIRASSDAIRALRCGRVALESTILK